MKKLFSKRKKQPKMLTLKHLGIRPGMPRPKPKTDVTNEEGWYRP